MIERPDVNPITIEAMARSNAVGQYNLGAVYASGAGVPQDYCEAVTQEWAAKLRDEIASLMTREQIAEAQRLAREWKPKRTN